FQGRRHPRDMGAAERWGWTPADAGRKCAKDYYAPTPPKSNEEQLFFSARQLVVSRPAALETGLDARRRDAYRPPTMNTPFSLILCAAWFAAADAPPAPDAAPTRGAVLVLENEETLTGDIERVGELY